MTKKNDTPTIPHFLQKVTSELKEDYFQPTNIDEWQLKKQITVFLATWEKQNDQERSLRKMIGVWVFILISFQVFGVFFLIFLDAIKCITLNQSLVQILIPSVLTEIFGLGYVVTKYLFNLTRLDSLIFDKIKRR